MRPLRAIRSTSSATDRSVESYSSPAAYPANSGIPPQRSTRRVKASGSAVRRSDPRTSSNRALIASSASGPTRTAAGRRVPRPRTGSRLVVITTVPGGSDRKGSTWAAVRTSSSRITTGLPSVCWRKRLSLPSRVSNPGASVSTPTAWKYSSHTCSTPLPRPSPGSPPQATASWAWPKRCRFWMIQVRTRVVLPTAGPPTTLHSQPPSPDSARSRRVSSRASSSVRFWKTLVSRRGRIRTVLTSGWWMLTAPPTRTDLDLRAVVVAL